MVRDDITERIAAFLDRHNVMSLATVGPSGVHAANLFYARDELSLVWVSDRDSRHSRELEANGFVAATIAAESAEFNTVQGLQIHGHAQRISRDEGGDRLLSLLSAKFPFLTRLDVVPRAMQVAFARAEIYLLRPTEIVLIDNTKRFGHKETLVIRKSPSQSSPAQGERA